jgi:hypothetical protein
MPVLRTERQGYIIQVPPAPEGQGLAGVRRHRPPSGAFIGSLTRIHGYLVLRYGMPDNKRILWVAGRSGTEWHGSAVNFIYLSDAHQHRIGSQQHVTQQIFFICIEWANIDRRRAGRDVACRQTRDLSSHEYARGWAEPTRTTGALKNEHQLTRTFLPATNVRLSLVDLPAIYDDASAVSERDKLSVKRL